MPSLRGLEALTALTRHGSLAAAAQVLGVTRSALSHRIAELERELGIAMIEREGRSVRLTDDAEALLGNIGDALQRIQSAIEPLRRRSGQLRVSTVGTFASCWLLPRLPQFRSRHPDIEISLSTTRRTIDFRREDLDCAIRHGKGGWTGLDATLLFQETLVPVAAPGADQRLGSRYIIRARSRYGDWTYWWKATGQGDKPHAGGLVVETRAQALEAAIAGTGIAMMDMAYAEPLIADGRLVRLGAAVKLDQGYYIVHSPTPRNERSIGAFRSWLLANVRPADPVCR